MDLEPECKNERMTRSAIKDDQSEAEKKSANSRRVAGSGFIRRSGSQARHLLIKSTKRSSSDLRICANVFDEGRLLLPFELTTGRGAPVESIEPTWEWTASEVSILVRPSRSDGEKRRGDASEQCVPKNNFRRELFSIKCFSGTPRTSIMHANCSCSFSPGNMGKPVNISARMQPRLHI